MLSKKSKETALQKAYSHLTPLKNFVYGVGRTVFDAKSAIHAVLAIDMSDKMFAGNPPYYSDYRIAEVFLETALRALKPGGLCYTVVKNDAGLKPVQERYFPSVEVIKRRGYCVLKSIKPV